MSFYNFKINMKQLIPYILLVIMIYTFASLGMWQLDRASEKEETLAIFNSSEGYETVVDNSIFTAYQKIKATGQYDSSRQIIIDNIIRDGGLGQMIVTPFKLSRSSKILLINRGWIRKKLDSDPEINDLNNGTLEIRGLSGNLPKVTIRDREGFIGNTDWPLKGSYPTIEEIANRLNEPIFPFILLLDQEEDNGFLRNWDPNISGPATNYGYAVQWFLMCLCSIILLGYRIKKNIF